MKNKPLKKLSISQPKDKSLEAYKAWVMEIVERLTTEKAGIKWTEEEWMENWKKFWQENPPS